MKLPADDLMARVRSLIKRKSMGITTYGEDGELDELLGQIEQMVASTSRRLDQTQYRMRTMMEAIPLGLLVTSEPGEVQAANKAALDLLDCKSDELAARQLSELFFEDDKPFVLATECTGTVEGQPIEVVAQGPHGKQFPAELIIRPFSVGTATSWLVAFQDVSARHEIESMKEAFVSMLSHDLRTPLTSIQAFLEHLVQGTYDGNLDLLKKKANDVDSDIDRLIGMISALLDVYKLEAGRLEMFFDVIPCHSIIKRSVQSVISLAEKENITIEHEEAGKDLYVKADADYVVQVMVNLLSNAIKFSPRGESVSISVTSEAEFVKIAVSDQGVGISKEAQARLFSRFEQARVSDARIKGGTGLGLAFARAIVEQHGGTIGVVSEENEGSTFWFTLPRMSLDIAE